jgi:polar amino acid transport system substrate-binding protein
MRSTIALVVVFALALVLGHLTSTPQVEAPKVETAFERVLRTGTLRCGYVAWPPFLIKDPNTGAVSGIAADFMNAIADELALKLDWAEEVGWGNFHEGLNANRYDAMCVPVWESGARARIALLSRPLYNSPLFAYARDDDNRFDASLDAINDPSVRVTTLEGDVTRAIRAQLFPKSQELAIPQMGDPSEMVLNVTMKKADISLDNPFAVRTFNEKSNDKLKAVGGGKPVRLFANTIAVRLGETDFKNLLDSTIDALDVSGTSARIIAKYPDFSPITARP